MTSLRPEIATEGWRKLHAGEVSPDFAIATVRLALDSGYGEVRLALGEARAPQLLIPTAVGRRVPEALSAVGVRVRNVQYVVHGRVQTFIEVESAIRTLDDAFEQLVEAILHRLAGGAAPEAAVAGAITDLRELLRRERARDPEFVVGLFGELTVVRDLLDVDQEAVVAWTGPIPHRHDFSGRTLALEVKTTTGRSTGYATISSVDQLAAPAHGGDLYLLLIRVERAGAGGRTVHELLEDISRRCTTPPVLDEALARLRLEDWRSDESLKADRLSVVARTLYRVASGFPRIVPGSFTDGRVPLGVRDVRYTIDLATADRFRLEPEVFRDVLICLAGRS
jgi:hypothetical protein